jgi:hypothetical protein
MSNISNNRAQPDSGLDHRTHFDGVPFLDDTRPSSPHYVVKLKTFPNGKYEMTCTKVLEPIRFGKKRKSGDGDDVLVTESLDRVRDIQNKQRSIRRTKKTIRDRALMMQADRMVTLTTRENITDLNQFMKMVVRWNRLVRETFKDKYHYVIVAERQKRGAWHAHIATNKFFYIPILQKLWERVVGKGNGNVDMSYKQRRDPVKIARYISKYITKNLKLSDIEEIPNRNRYRTSQGLCPPIETAYMPLTGGQAMYMFTNIFKSVTNCNGVFVWENDFCFYFNNFDSEVPKCH